MFIEMTETLARPDQCYRAGEAYDVGPELALDWIGAGMAHPTQKIPRTLAPLFDRLADGAGRPCLFLPFFGEFGHLIMNHIRIVHFHQATDKIVCCRKGEEVLFPSADAFFTDWIDPIPDTIRVATIRDTVYTWPEICARFPDHHPVRAGLLNAESEIYPLHPETRIPFDCHHRMDFPPVDVLLGVRRRQYCPSRNWRHWNDLADALADARITYATIGGADTSSDVIGQEWHSRGDTQGAIYALARSRLYVGNDSGVSHLAAEVGAPMLVFRETRSGSRDLTPRMRAVNARVEVMPAEAWDRPEMVANRILERLGKA